MNAQRLFLRILSRLPRGAVRLLAGRPIIGRGADLDPVMQLIWIGGKKQPPVETLSPAAARTALETAAETLQSDLPASVDVRDDAIPGPAGKIPIRVYRPESAAGTLPITLFFHFGGCVIGSRAICHGFCGLLCARARTIVVNVEYRLAPEHPFPAPVEDALATYQWFLEHAPAIGGDPSRIAVAGDSAGGLLSAVIAQEAKRQGWRRPRCQLLIYPWLVPYSGLPSYGDFAESYPLGAATMNWFGDHFFGSEDDKKHPWAAPLNEAEVGDLPEALIVTAGFDPLRDEGARYAKRLAEAGVPVTYRCYEHLTHAFSMLGGVVPAAEEALSEIADDLARKIHAA